MAEMLEMNYFSQHIQCSRLDKQDCLPVVGLLMELAHLAHSFGLVEMDHYIHQDPVKFNDPFLKKAMSAIVDIADTDFTQKILYQYLLTGNYVGQPFLKNVLIVETALAIQRDTPLDHIFSFLVPSFFGLDYEPSLIELYRNFKISRGLNIEEEGPPSMQQPDTSDDE